MAKQTEQVPVLRARARFLWAPPDTTVSASATPSSAPLEFAVGLYSNGTVNLDAPPPHAGLVAGLEWVDANDAIKNDGGYWSPRSTWDAYTKEHLLLKATNALRRQLALPPHMMTPQWPGSE